MGYLQDLAFAFFIPNDFYNEKADQLNFSSAIKHLLFSSLISTALYFLFFLAAFNFFFAIQHNNLFRYGMGNILLKQITLSEKILTSLSRAFFTIIALIVLIHILILAYHLLIIIMGCSKGFKKTYEAAIYGFSFVLLFAAIPLVNVLFWLWSWYPQIIGLKKLHCISGVKASISLILPSLALIFLYMLLISYL